MVLNGNVDQQRPNPSVAGVTEKGICWPYEQLAGAKQRLHLLTLRNTIFVKYSTVQFQHQEKHFTNEKKNSVILWGNNSLATFQVITAVLMRIQFFWAVTLCRRTIGILRSFLPPDDTVSYPTRPESNKKQLVSCDRQEKHSKKLRGQAAMISNVQRVVLTSLQIPTQTSNPITGLDRP